MKEEIEIEKNGGISLSIVFDGNDDIEARKFIELLNDGIVPFTGRRTEKSFGELERTLVEKMERDVPDYRVFPPENAISRRAWRLFEIRRRYERAMASFGEDAEVFSLWLIRKYKSEEKLINHLSAVVRNISVKRRKQ